NSQAMHRHYHRTTLFPYTTLFRSPAFTNPGGKGEPNIDDLLWRRHERATDNIWQRQALISFRSALTKIKDSSLLHFPIIPDPDRSEEHTSELQSRSDLVCRLLLEK